MIVRPGKTKSVPLNIVGSSTFGRYPKISNERTYNMFQSDTFMVPYAGYQIAISFAEFTMGKVGRGIFTSTKLGRLIIVIDNKVYLVNIQSSAYGVITSHQVILIGTLLTSTGVVYITENNKPQIAISDNTAIYIYDPSLGTPFQIAPTPDFTPGYITFHDTYFLCAASDDDFYTPPASNTWRLSSQNDGLVWPSNSSSIGLLQTKPDNVQAVVRFPSKGNMILVMGQTVTEAWFDTGAQLFPYQRTTQMNIDYGCLSPGTVAYMDELVVWLASNEKSGPIIMYSNGGMPEKITTDGIDYEFSQLINPEDSEGFLYRQDGHLFYHINFYTDNLSFFIDFNTKKIYNACDQNLNYFIASEVAFFNNQYYFVTKNNGNLFTFDTIFTTYQDTDMANNIVVNEIPRFRTCGNIRLPSQEYYIINDIGFTIETGETNYQNQTLPNGTIVNTTPRVDLSLSYDGGATFGNNFGYVLNPIGQRRNRLNWWQCGISNDSVCQFAFWGMGRFVVTDGIVNIRQ